VFASCGLHPEFPLLTWEEVGDSLESILAWASRLQDRVQYVVVENATSALSDFTYWNGTEQAQRFREAFSPSVLQMEFRLAELDNPVRQHGIKLGDVADRKASVGELTRGSLVMRAQSYRRRPPNSTAPKRCSCREQCARNS
jgi:hypothetical protein